MDHKSSNIAETCPECGAPRVNGLACWEQLNMLIGWESQDPELLAEHYLTIASYNLQHPARFTESALTNLRRGFIERLDLGTPVEELRRRAGRAFRGSQRVIKGKFEQSPALGFWEMTIADIYLPDKPDGAATMVRTWAASIRKTLR